MADSNAVFQIGVDRVFIGAVEAGATALLRQVEDLESVRIKYAHDLEKITRLREQARNLDEFAKAARLHLVTR